MFRATGVATIRFFESIFDYLEVVGKMVLSTPLLFRNGKQSFRDYGKELYFCGPKNFLFINTIAFIFGAVIVAISATMFQKVGKPIYAVNIVGIAAARYIMPFFIAIFLLFLSAARFTDEIYSLKKIDKQVYSQCLVRIFAMASAAPLLTLFAFYSAILGGALIGEQQFGINFGQYWDQILSAVSFTDISLGLFKTFLFGIEIAFLGCFYGLVAQFGKKSLGRSIISTISIGLLLVILTNGSMEIVMSVF